MTDPRLVGVWAYARIQKPLKPQKSLDRMPCGA